MFRRWIFPAERLERNAERRLFAYSRHPYLDAVCTQIIQIWVMGHDIYLSFLEYMDWEELLRALLRNSRKDP